MNQDELRAALSVLVAERCKRSDGAGESLAVVGAVLAQLTDPPRTPLTRQYVQILASGKARITEPLGRAILTLTAMQVSRTDDDVAGIQARARFVTAPIYSVHDLPAHAVITDPAHKCRRACCGPDHRRAAARRRAAVNKSNGGHHPPHYRSED
jgi:hypothetical protein